MGVREYIGQNSIKSDDGLVLPAASFGLFAVRSLDDKTLLYVLHQSIGEPIGTNCGVVVPKNLILFTKGQNNGHVIATFLDQLSQLNEKTASMYYTCFKWQSRHEYWRRTNV